jgi:hypothetical protein
VTAEPPWVLACPVVITRPRPPVVAVSLVPQGTIGVPRPRVRVVQDRPPPAPAVVRLAARPQGPWRVPLAPALAAMLASPTMVTRR